MACADSDNTRLLLRSAALAHGAGRLGEHVRVFMFHGAGIFSHKLVTILTINLSGGHRAVAILLYNARLGPAMAGHTLIFVPATGQRIGALFLLARHKRAKESAQSTPDPSTRLQRRGQ